MPTIKRRRKRPEMRDQYAHNDREEVETLTSELLLTVMYPPLEDEATEKAYEELSSWVTDVAKVAEKLYRKRQLLGE